ncbi:MAG: hypothetical protein A3B28_00580 [Candidatus Wildermuthbacteria bacterium RIFCSPLOWO2_01_FULL_50_46]|nr:MAG: hypothetical protein A3B28_00580 [Candidatus Wildermuthbacteria bacterium RIFCSPLOWO2_01_FULL_50_46]
MDVAVVLAHLIKGGLVAPVIHDENGSERHMPLFYESIQEWPDHRSPLPHRNDNRQLPALQETIDAFLLNPQILCVRLQVAGVQVSLKVPGQQPIDVLVGLLHSEGINPPENNLKLVILYGHVLLLPRSFCCPL